MPVSQKDDFAFKSYWLDHLLAPRMNHKDHESWREIWCKELAPESNPAGEEEIRVSARVRGDTHASVQSYRCLPIGPEVELTLFALQDRRLSKVAHS